jgi:hypothetical protein
VWNVRFHPAKVVEELLLRIERLFRVLHFLAVPDVKALRAPIHTDRFPGFMAAIAKRDGTGHMSFVSRFQKRLISWLCLAAMLFAQAAYANQACMAVEAANVMPCHEQGPADRNFCQNHCLAEQQTLDASKLPVVFPMEEVVLAVPVAGARSVESVFLSFSRAHARGGSPPLSILHCCFRI